METQSLSNETSKVIRTKDSQNNAAFEIRVSNAGSSISILTLNCKDGNFVNSIYTKTLYAGAIQLANTSLYVSNKRVMSFEYTQEGETVTAYLENNWGSRDITIKIKDSSGNAYTLKQRKTFYFKIHFTWGSWSEIKSMTIDVGSSGKTQTFPSAFIGYDDSQFIDSGTKELQRTIDIFEVDVNAYEPYVKDINREIELIKKWRQKDNQIKTHLKG